MGKFKDTKFINTVDNLVEATKSKLVNPYYIFSDRSPTKVTYYSQNVEKSTLDQASGLYMQHLGEQSPFLFNKINEFVLYGIEKISTEYDVGDFGTEANSISGEAIVLPNTIQPRPGDFFVINYIKEPILFKVNSVSPDTLDTGANFYRLEYGLEKSGAHDIESIEKQVIKTFDFVIDNVGTDFKTILESSDKKLVETVSSLIEQFIICFESIFFNNRLQTFVYNHDGWNMYDPYFIEFLIRNRVFDFYDKYVHIDHATYVDKTFAMDYSKTIFKALEDKSLGNCKTFATAEQISDPNSLFAVRLEKYYKVRYNDRCTVYKTRFQTIDPDVLDHIRSNEMYGDGDDREFYNIFIAYFNGNDSYITGDVLEKIKNIDYLDNLNYFYTLGIVIFILEDYVKSILS